MKLILILIFFYNTWQQRDCPLTTTPLIAWSWGGGGGGWMESKRSLKIAENRVWYTSMYIHSWMRYNFVRVKTLMGIHWFEVQKNISWISTKIELGGRQTIKIAWNFGMVYFLVYIFMSLGKFVFVKTLMGLLWF